MEGVFGNLFADDVDGTGDISQSNTKSGIAQPPRVRGQSEICGIDNQGATCYLNSLIQTLLFTPEFREGLFCLDDQELGKLEDADKPGAKVRVIPIQLQKLFARLLLKNCQSVSSKDLTTSFGWTDNEQFQQHDVQELNRILFSAIESSLVGTAGRDLIRQLYHGKIANQIRCTVCGHVSESQEDFLDLSVTVAGSAGLEQSLLAAYHEVEMLDGRNQYKCASCNKLVDAEKGAKLRSLPPILTLSLLRFSFDYQKLDRYKETGKFTFPTKLDMRQYCDQVHEGEDLQYELFSVVIHSGGAHGGHYHAYIRDIDAIGHWVTPDEEEILVPTDPLTGGVDFIECDSPVELVVFILAKEKNKGMTIDKLGQAILTQTGMSWNKRFKNKHGTITKFLTKYDDKFIFDPSSKNVSLKLLGPNDTGSLKTVPYTGNTKSVTSPVRNRNNPLLSLDAARGVSSPTKSLQTSSAVCTCNPVQNGSPGKSPCDQSSRACAGNSGKICHGKGDSKQKQCDNTPNPGWAWFDYNDSRVHPIYEKAIEKQFSGRESAYMLFYRKRTLIRPNKAHGDKMYCMPERLVLEMAEENSQLDKLRTEYDLEMNKLTLQIHFSRCYQYREGALKPHTGMNAWIDLVIDQRKTTMDLYRQVIEMGTDYLPCNDFMISTFKELPAGGHIYDNVPEDDAFQLLHHGIADGAKLFVWDGCTVDGQTVPTGGSKEPIYVTIIYGENLQYSCGFSRSLTLRELKTVACDCIRMDANAMKLKRVFGKDMDVRFVEFSSTDASATIGDLGFKDGDQLLAEDTKKRSELTRESVSSTIYSTKFVVHAESRCAGTEHNRTQHSPVTVEVERTILVSELKDIIKTKFGNPTVTDGGRLRIDHDSLGLRPPLHEGVTIFDAGITQGSRLVLEEGPPPNTDEITLYFTCESSVSGPDYSEVMVNQNHTVGQCLKCILLQANIPDEDWHLRKTNWCGEAADLLDDLDVTLTSSQVNDGDTLLLERGRLPPKGFIRLPIWLHSTPESVRASPASQGGILSWVSGLLGAQSSGNDTVRAEEIATSLQPRLLGDVEISRDSTLSDLKEQVMTLSLVAELPIPSKDFIRLRLKEKDQLSTVLRDPDQTLRRCKLTSNSVIALQILPEEEQLSTNHIVLDVCQRIPDTREYDPALELVWNTNSGASVHSLKQAISEVLFIDTEHICMAKHIHQRHEWLVIDKSNMVMQKGKKRGQIKDNIKQAPFNIKDGDTIGVKDTRYDPNNLDDFSTIQDDEGRLYMKQQEEEKRRMREERRKLASDLGLGPKQHRPEVGITIKVGDFS